MRRFTVMGFTEAELGFVLAAVFAAMAVAGLSAQQTHDTVVAKSDTLQKKYDSVSAAFTAYRDSVRKKSNKTPRCSEKGQSAAAIADLRIVGRDGYELDGQRLSFAEIEARFAPQIATSTSLGCRFLVRTIATSGVDGPDHSIAIGKLWTRFDVTERHP